MLKRLKFEIPILLGNIGKKLLAVTFEPLEAAGSP